MSKKETATQPLDKDAILKAYKVPLMLRPLVGAAIDWLNTADLTGDGIPDLVQVTPYAAKATPFLATLLPLVNWSAVIDWLFTHDFFHNQQEARKQINEIINLGGEAAKSLSTTEKPQ